MDTVLKLATAERSVTKMAGAYPREDVAHSAARRLESEAGLTPSQVRVLSPSMARTSLRSYLGRQVEPEDRGIWRTLIKSHVVFGIVGIVAGLIAYAALRESPAVQSSPWMAFAVIVFFCTIAGLMLGGLVALRPDHAKLMSQVRRSLAEGSWVVVAHPRTDAQVEAAGSVLDASAMQVFRTL